MTRPQPKPSAADQKYLDHQAHVRMMAGVYKGYRLAEKMTVEQLRELWDGRNGSSTENNAISAECVRFRLGELDDARYCTK